MAPTDTAYAQKLFQRALSVCAPGDASLTDAIHGEVVLAAKESTITDVIYDTPTIRTVEEKILACVTGQMTGKHPDLKPSGQERHVSF